MNPCIISRQLTESAITRKRHNENHTRRLCHFGARGKTHDGPHWPYPGQYTSLGLTAKRYRWDMLERTQIKIGDGINIDGDVNIYAYANNNHIDTALRKITKTK